MYLSKVTLNGALSLAEVLLALDKNNAYASHQFIWKELFHHASQRQFIYRQEIDQRKMPCFYVLSRHEPGNSQVLNVQTKRFVPKLHKGQTLAYQLRVNPTVCKSDEHGHSKRHDVLMNAKRQYKPRLAPDELKQKMDEAAQQWICNEARLERWGIELPHVPEIEAYTQYKSYKKQRNENRQLIQFSSVDIQGILTVRDPARFLAQYVQGFGRAKSMGCGLMLIRGM
ncbi:MAG: CRISPR system Cascade subunit CasE [Candidatus Celerinatantimonas neptuna]|nr:MAG: CRISPR system Cascade subunit CasE [Candidatus Celerinatantimonas neptuna]